jgi:hypothetical protein
MISQPLHVRVGAEVGHKVSDIIALRLMKAAALDAGVLHEAGVPKRHWMAAFFLGVGVRRCHVALMKR